MRLILLIACSFALAAGLFAGVASARFAEPDERAGAPRAPFDPPAAMPRRDAVQPNAWGFRSSDAIAAKFGDASSAPASSASGSGGATIAVTATVLPVVFIVVDGRSGRVESLTTNTDERDASSVLYLVRADSVDGAHRRLDAVTWKSARRALARTTAGTGVVWSR